MPNVTEPSLLSTERRASLIIGLTMIVALATALQICWKVGAADIDDDIPLWASGNAMLEAPLLLLVLALVAIQFVTWLRVLALADLSFARVFSALSYAMIGVISALALGERLTLLQGAGIAAIMAGVWCVSLTDRAPGDVP